MVKEFYTNARKIGDYPAKDYLGYVRGHAIRYDPDSINNFLGQVATAEMIVGMYDTPPAHMWTMDEFHNVVAWPEEQA
ncbi:hypothetical protein LR48_Vigan09g087600 [Vigna angularis]|uniref:Putative plant transposon protein domain-containing protein n=1 Tax=Phaseolus angularis TaxID=3914 RepID=A0A0L9VBB8_PHAAN|nr:hypothetical protein LR48_Vigan09g087600 [Vigna angularis]